MNTNWAIFWIVIYPMDSAVHPVSTNWGLVDYSKFLCSSARMLQLNSNAFCEEEYTPRILAVWCRLIAFTFDVCDRLSFVCRS